MPNFLRSLATYVAAMIGIVGTLVVIYAWNLPPFKSSVEMTNDAYVRGQITLLSPQLAGYIIDVPVQDYQIVRRGDLIAQIDDRIFAQKLEQARATLTTAEASLANSEQSKKSAEAKILSAKASVESANAGLEASRAAFGRSSELRAKNIASQSEVERDRAAFDQAQAAVHQAQAQALIAEQDLSTIIVGRKSLEANVQSAKASIRLAEIDLANTRIVAPRDGQLGEVTGRVGQYVSAGTQIALVVPDHVWVVANFKETQVADMHAGQAVSFTVDALKNQKFIGRLERFAPATGSEFSVLKADNATGNFTKIAQRIPVRLAIDPGQAMLEKLVPGMSVVATIDVSQTAAGTTKAGG